MESIALTLSILHSTQDETVFFAFLCFHRLMEMIGGLTSSSLSSIFLLEGGPDSGRR